MWLCDICQKEMMFNTKSKHITSNTHINRKENGIVVEKYEIIKPETDEVDDILREVIKDYREKFFHTFEKKCMYINFTKKENNEVINLTINHGFMCFKSEFDGLNKKNKNAQRERTYI